MKKTSEKTLYFGKNEFKELMIPMSVFMLLVTMFTCIVAICESCMR